MYPGVRERSFRSQCKIFESFGIADDDTDEKRRRRRCNRKKRKEIKRNEREIIDEGTVCHRVQTVLTSRLAFLVIIEFPEEQKFSPDQ